MNGTRPDGDPLETRFGAAPSQDDLEARQWRQSVSARLFGHAHDPVKLGRFTVLERLGAGGSGVVFSAWDPRLQRRVAVKLLHAGRDHQTLEREARMLAQLNHPNVVAIYDVGESDGATFFAMEYVDGWTLEQWARDNPPGWRDAVEVVMQVARGLSTAHGIGLVHGDVKPTNILVGRDGRTRIGDFGIARHRDDAGRRGGTPAYMSAEQARGEPPTPRSDQFALCVTLYELLHGRRPFEASTEASLRERLIRGDREPIPESRTIPRWLHTSIERGLCIRAEERYPDLATLLRAWETGARGRRRAAMVGGVGVALVATSLAFTAGVRAQDRSSACTRAHDRLQQIWSAPTREALAAKLGGNAAPYAADVWTRVESKLDTHTAQLQQAIDASCDGDPETALRQQLCVQRRLTELDAWVAVLTSTEMGVVEYAVQSLSMLTPPSTCRTATRGRTQTRSDEAQRTALYADLARARALRGVSRYVEAIALLRDVRERARDLGDSRTVALVLLELGRHHTQTMGLLDESPAEPLLEAASLAAEVAEDDRLVATAMLELANANFRSARFDDASHWLARLDARFEGFEDAQLRGRAEVLRALIESVRDGSTEIHPTRRAVETLQSLGVRDTWFASALNNLGELEFDRGNYEAARHHYERALQIWIEMVGPAHPSAAGAHGNLGEIELFAGNLDAARVHFQRAADIRSAATGPHSLWTVHTIAHIADVERRAGRLDVAHAAYTAVLDARRRPTSEHGASGFFDLDSGTDQLEPWARNGLALIALARDQPAQALEYTTAISPDVEIRAGRHPDLAARFDVHALALLKLGRAEEGLAAVARFEDRLRSTYGPTSYKSAYAPLARGRLHAALGEMMQACEAWQTAQDVIRSDPATPRARREDLETLLTHCSAPRSSPPPTRSAN